MTGRVNAPSTLSPAEQNLPLQTAAFTAKASFGLDEGTGTRRVLGGAPKEFVATVAGGGAQLGVAGKAGTGLKLNGSSAYAATAGPVVDTTKSFSVSAWVKLDDKNANHTFLSQAGSRASGFQLYYSKWYDRWVFNRHVKDTDDTGIVRSMSSSAAQVGVWTHLTGVYDASAKKIQLFVNGKPQTAATFTTPWRASGGLQIGRVRYKGAFQEYFTGTVDDVRLVQSVATQTEVEAIGRGGLPARLQELASFRLDEGAGSARVSGGMGAGPVATVAGGGAQLGVAGKAGTGLKLNGSSAYAATAGPVVDTTKSFSVSAWVKLDDKNANHTFLSQAGSRASGFQLYYSKWYDRWVFNRHVKDTDDTGIVRSVSSTAAQVGVWTHLEGVYDASAKKIQLFVNGKPQAAASFTTPWRALGGLQIGRVLYKGAFQEYVPGTIDDVFLSDDTSAADCSRTDGLGHRGAPQIAPENTIASMDAAADRGADWVETDVQFTKDGQPVIMHDDTVDRTTDGTGRVDELTAEEISKLTVKGGGHVPTLEELLSSVKARSTRLLLELKGPQTPAAVDHALRLVSEAGMTERTVVQSFDENIVRQAKTSPYGIKVALLRDALDADPVATARSFSLDTYAVNFNGLAARPTALAELHAAGVKVFVWTVDTDTKWKTATSWGVDGVITNRVGDFVQWRKDNCATR
ncbi:glycerophosphodiester phosphodiesterase family protein [Streptomyces sp. Y2F8-2]|uniref:glycerophosphodiester phosphodiesterase family protein n=1 Tax=unclassified Streptomyces TaxID=2593676 RepID=UPI0019052193|nr:glycerophosphodiester phosphodiesterase family protein [Streptomyces sp. Y2F8-2]